MTDGKTIHGRNRLTNETIDRMQSHFGEAIYKNSGNIENVKKDIKTVLHHMVQNEKMSLEEQHSYCSRDSWCKFW